MPDKIEIKPTGPLNCSVRPPGSKSITNRALVCAALADGRSVLTGVLDSEDTRVMIEGLQTLGITVSVDHARKTIIVEGCGGRIPASRAEIFVANSGTTIRFLTSLVSLGNGRYRLDGAARMRQRPIGDLLDALNQLGADVKSETGSGCPPVIAHANGLGGGTTTIRGDISSQFLSGLLMAAPYATSDILMDVDGELVSKPYVEMTMRVMEAFGTVVATDDLQVFRIPSGVGYRGCQYAVEPDASAASYFWAAAAVTKGTVTVEGLSRDALQGDVRFCECLEQMGCTVNYAHDRISVSGGDLQGIDVNMSDISDTVQTLAAVALFASGATRITGVEHIRHKETDRIGDLATELRKLGAIVDEQPDGLLIRPQRLTGCEIQTYDDHRMAMSMTVVGLCIPGVVIRDPGCTRKTYPEFFSDWQKLS